MKLCYIWMALTQHIKLLRWKGKGRGGGGSGQSNQVHYGQRLPTAVLELMVR